MQRYYLLQNPLELGSKYPTGSAFQGIGHGLREVWGAQSIRDAKLIMVEIGEAELQRLLDAAPAVAAPHVVHPAPGEAHALPIRRRFVRAVTRAPASLAASISEVISQAVHASGRAVPVAAASPRTTFRGG